MAFDTQSLSTAINDFHRARQRALLQRIFDRLRGKSTELLSYEEITEKLRATSRIEHGLRVIPVDAIVGSVGRYTDFTRTFLPRVKSDAERWARVKQASAEKLLPPIEVYQIGEAYFVLDGNHRVSIARQQGRSYMDAHVIEVRTMVPLSPNDQPDELIIKAEFAAFLAHTRLDQLRPKSDLTVSAPGKYAKLENHIEVHRYFIEVAQEIELSDEEAVCLWHDEAYLPMIEAIREQGVLRYFPGRTETDFYIWLATHQAALQNELGWQIRPEAAVGKLATRFSPDPEGKMTRMGRRILDIVAPEKWRSGPKPETWSQERIMARYSDRLFAEILTPLKSDGNWQPMEQALRVAHHEDAQLYGLHVLEDAVGQDQAIKAMREEFRRRCQEREVDGEMAVELGLAAEKIRERALLADLVVLGWKPSPEKAEKVSNMKTVIQQGARPVLVVPGSASPMDRILLAFDGKEKAREALFVATYIAEQWGSKMFVVTVLEGNNVTQETMDHAREYLEMHEVEGEFVVGQGPGVAEVILQTAVEYQIDLVVMGGTSSGLFSRRSSGQMLESILAEWRQPLLVCP